MKTRILTIALTLVFALNAYAAGKWNLECHEDELTNEVSVSAVSPEADVVLKPGFPYDNIATRLYVNIKPYGNLPVSVAIWAERMNLVGGEYPPKDNSFKEYKLRGKFSPSDKLETYSVLQHDIEKRFAFFQWSKRTYNLILNNDSLLLEIPYATGKGRYRYEWDKEDFANQVSALKKTCFGKR